MFVSHHTLKWTRTCRSHGRHPHAHTAHFLLNRHTAELLGAGVGAVNHWVRTYREGGMAALRPENRDAGQADKPAVRRDRDAGDAEAPRRRVEEPELGNALMREVVKARRKRPKR